MKKQNKKAANPPKELKHATYEIFILALTILSLFNLLFVWLLPLNQVTRNVMYAMEIFLSIIFLIDFSFRLFSAEVKKVYFFKEYGWVDFLGSLPFPEIRILRTLRLIRAGKMLKEYGINNIFSQIRDNLAVSSLYLVAFIIVLVLEWGAIFVLAAERTSSAANIKTASDGIWYTFVTITTVGYGDRYPVTNVGRMIGIVIMITGVSSFGVLTGFLAKFFLSPKEKV